MPLAANSQISKSFMSPDCQLLGFATNYKPEPDLVWDIKKCFRLNCLVDVLIVKIKASLPRILKDTNNNLEISVAMLVLNDWTSINAKFSFEKCIVPKNHNPEEEIKAIVVESAMRPKL